MNDTHFSYPFSRLLTAASYEARLFNLITQKETVYSQVTERTSRIVFLLPQSGQLKHWT